MHSFELHPSEMTDWHPFSPSREAHLLAALPRTAGVFVIRRQTPYPRERGVSDIAYVGSAARSIGLKGRIRQYFHPGPTQSTHQNALAMIADSNEFELGFAECQDAAKTKSLKQALLSRYSIQHGELPPWNRRRGSRTTNTHTVLDLIRKHPEGLDDDEITEMTGIRPRQQIYQICTRLEGGGQVCRESVEKPGKRKKIHNFPIEAGRVATGGSPKSRQRTWQKRLGALVAATGKGEDELLDQALQDLAIKVLEAQG